MREQDLKMLCPLMLMEYYEMNGIDVWKIKKKNYYEMIINRYKDIYIYNH